jgi:hypothetical protein
MCQAKKYNCSLPCNQEQSHAPIPTKDSKGKIAKQNVQERPIKGKDLADLLLSASVFPLQFLHVRNIGVMAGTLTTILLAKK